MIIATGAIVFYSCQKNGAEIEQQSSEIKTTSNYDPSIVAPQPIIVHFNAARTVEPDVCIKKTVNNKLQSTSTSGFSEFINDGDGEMYNFRDNFLAQTPKGLEYIDNYYKVSIFLAKYNLIETSFSDLFQTFSYAVDVSKKMSSTNNSQIIVDDNMYNFLKAKSVQIHQHPNFSEISAIFNVLDADLEILRGKTKLQFISFFNGGL
jgi:hypothetical protein